VASAAKLQSGKRSDEGGASQNLSWQTEAWQMYDSVGQFRRGVTWLSNVLSRARVIAAKAPAVPGDEPEPIDPETDDPAVGLVQAIGGGIGGQSELLRSATVHLTVPGEGWFVGEVPDGVEDAADLSWKFYSRDEVRDGRHGEGTVEVQIEENRWRTLPAESLPVRVWRPHDRFHWKADSSTRAAMGTLRTLVLLNRKRDAQIQSRLACNGMYWIPEEMEFPVKEQYAEADDPFAAELLDDWTTAIGTPGSAAAAVPFVGRGRSEWLDKIRYDDFAKLADPEINAEIEGVVKELASEIDVPSEVLLGMVGLNHWGAWQVEESALKTTVTSLLELVCWSLTTGYLRPALGAMRAQRSVMPLDQEVEDIPPEFERIIWYDLSELTVRPDRSSNAITLHGSLTINDEAALRETGFDGNDLLTDEAELRRRIGLLWVQNPATAAAGAELLGITLQAAITPGPGRPTVELPGEAPSSEPGAMPANDTPQTTPETNGDEPAPSPASEGVPVP
jgi:hypothetical protein